MAEADINQILGYIKEREATLSHYSDKLRQNLQRIFDIFGHPDYCQVCDVSEGSLKHKGQKYADETAHVFIPKIRISLDLQDTEHFAEIGDEPEYYYLATKNGMLHIMGTVACEMDITGWTCWYRQPHEVSREVLKQLVRSGRLIPFLQKIADTLAQEGEEYKQVAEVAEKLAKAVSP